MRGLAFVAAASLLALSLPLDAQGQARRYRINVEGAPRIGLLDPHPRICGGAELTQRDLRVVRMAFGVNRDPASRWAPPWYLEPVQAEPLALRLRIEALWEIPAAWLADPDGAGHGRDPLAPWRRRVSRVLELEPPAADEGIVRLAQEKPGPFAWSRLHGSALLPRVEGWQSSRLGDDCPAWPAGVWLQPAEGDLRYVLTVSRPDRGAPFVLAGYRREAALWSDFRRERLDLVLVEGEDVADANLPPDTQAVWGVESGTQQIVLRPAPRLREEFGRERWSALSQALPREELAALYGPGRIAPARGFLTPLLRRRAAEAPVEFQSNPRDARRQWLNNPSPRQRLSLATIANPVLEALALRIGEQWERTLNLKTSLTPLPMDGFAASLAAWEHDLYLTVADLDDGSLQDLWERTLEAEGALQDLSPALTEKRLAAWEQALLKGLPYLPVVENVHYSVARDAAPIRAVCPACEVPARAPQRGPGGPGGAPGAAPPEPVVPPEG